MPHTSSPRRSASSATAQARPVSTKSTVYSRMADALRTAERKLGVKSVCGVTPGKVEQICLELFATLPRGTSIAEVRLIRKDANRPFSATDNYAVELRRGAAKHVLPPPVAAAPLEEAENAVAHLQRYGAFYQNARGEHVAQISQGIREVNVACDSLAPQAANSAITAYTAWASTQAAQIAQSAQLAWAAAQTEEARQAMLSAQVAVTAAKSAVIAAEGVCFATRTTHAAQAAQSARAKADADAATQAMHDAGALWKATQAQLPGLVAPVQLSESQSLQ